MKQLFKYLREPRDFFSHGFIRLTQVKVLNDPFEGVYCIEGLNKLSKYFDENIYDVNNNYIDYINKYKSYIGIISLSENKENLLMWAHYANEHKGLVAGIAQFEDEVIFENLISSSIVGTSSHQYCPFDGIAKPVSYKKGLRFRNDKFDYDYSNISAEGGDRFLYEIFMQKSEEWIYEQEHRIILRLEQADRVTIDDSPNSRNFLEKYINKNLKLCVSHDEEKKRIIIDLYMIQDEINRLILAGTIVENSELLNAIYLMKIKASSINNCLFGTKSTYLKDDIYNGYVNSIGYLDVWKARLNFDYYSLEFDEI